jgi:hypothetical protein
MCRMNSNAAGDDQAGSADTYGIFDAGLPKLGVVLQIVRVHFGFRLTASLVELALSGIDLSQGRTSASVATQCNTLPFISRLDVFAQQPLIDADCLGLVRIEPMGNRPLAGANYRTPQLAQERSTKAEMGTAGFRSGPARP